MKKGEFLFKLRERLKGLPQDDIDNRISFYSEMIDDRISEGVTEEQAISDIGGVEGVINDIAKDTPLVKLVKQKVTPKRSLTALEIVLIVLGFPLWFPLLLTFIILCFVAYLLIWVFSIVVYGLEISFTVFGLLEMVVAFSALANQNPAMIYFGMSLTALGLAFLFFFACVGVTKMTIAVNKSIFLSIKKSFMKGSK